MTMSEYESEINATRKPAFEFKPEKAKIALCHKQANMATLVLTIGIVPLRPSQTKRAPPGMADVVVNLQAINCVTCSCNGSGRAGPVREALRPFGSHFCKKFP